jgi:hypothetical protein
MMVFRFTSGTRKIRDAGLLAERHLAFRQRREICDHRTQLSAGDGEIEGILIEAERLAPTTLPRLGDEQVTPGTLGSSKSLMQALSLGDRKLKVVLTQATSSARAKVDVANKIIAQARILMLLDSMADAPL